MNTTRVATIALLGLSCIGVMASSTEAAKYRSQNYRSTSDPGRIMIPAGTSVNVQLDSKISTEDAQQGDTWTGTVSRSVLASNEVVIPAGAPVRGVVTRAVQGTRGTRPSIALSIRQVTMNGRSMSMTADTQPIVAGSKRAKKLGAIAGGAAVGALLGRAVAKDQQGTLIGGAVGGAAGYGLTRSALRTMQLKPGTELTFTTRGDVLANR